ncbi:deoxyribose-phosphate aldolase [Aureimonas altamirensis]|uniref:deoxyribose-phosphate aldolase n=1 Tax=Aureimonas altamirensis TaxID=370622 RepID=UPI00255286FC|nr:deoxyribose-phosphate aldolase [Aureimonas altamirensis]
MQDQDLARLLVSCLDLTDLSDTCAQGDIASLIARAQTQVGPVAVICIWPRFVAFARRLAGERMRIATVVNFPSGTADVGASVEEAAQAIADGADEIDYVLSREATVAEVSAMCDACEGRTLKVILETGEREDASAIARAAQAALEGGADFIKTSTGKTRMGATPEAVAVMLDALRRSGRAAGIKPSGGIRGFSVARRYFDMAEAAMGTGWVGPATFRLGASSLLIDLLAVAEGQPSAESQEGY